MIKQITIILCVLYSTFFTGCWLPPSPRPDERVLTIPSLNLLLTDSSATVNTLHTATGHPTVLIYFSPECSFSCRQTEEIITNNALLHNIQFYLCSSYPMPVIKGFYHVYDLSRFHNITVGRDYEFFFSKQLKINSYPYLFIYTPDNRLKKIVTGMINAETIVKIIDG